MDLFSQFYSQLIDGIKSASLLEWLAVVSGIASVYFSRRENVLVYPVGLINTVIYTGLSLQYHLPGESAVNFYYSIMSIYGWYWWIRKDERKKPVLHISWSNKSMLASQLFFFIASYIVIYFALVYLKEHFYEGAIPWADALATSSAFVGMWLMTRKKVESWHWWILTNIVSIPLYFAKGLVLTSCYYLVLLGLAIAGLIEWKRRAAVYKKNANG